jgi:hypothetical protein
MHRESVSIRIIAVGGGRLSRGKTIALAIAAVAVGGIFLALGVALLASLAVVGTIAAAGVAIARVLRGRHSLPPRQDSLDPSMEVFPQGEREAPRLEGGPDAR